MNQPTSLRVGGTRAYAQGELFILTEAGDHLDALVYNTIGFGPCPKDEFDAIDTERLAAEVGCDRVWKNPRRFWMMDTLTVDIVGEEAEFEGVNFNLVARMSMPTDFDFDRDQSAMAYHPMQIHRVSTYQFESGRRVYLLRSPDGITWVMQTFTDHVNPTLTEDNLSGLGARLALPEGWEFKAPTLTRDLSITTDGLANIVPDDLSNMYQGCIDGVNDFDPWDVPSPKGN